MVLEKRRFVYMSTPLAYISFDPHNLELCKVWVVQKERPSEKLCNADNLLESVNWDWSQPSQQSHPFPPFRLFKQTGTNLSLQRNVKWQSL